MRPVSKGDSPGPFTDWIQARDPLISQLGAFCSYCESPAFQPDVEHKEPKSLTKYAHRKLEWDNFLLACGYCNPNKLAHDPRSPRFLFPDEVNTACIFEYVDGGFIRVSSLLTDPADIKAATDTRDIFLKLNRLLDTNGNRDLRWQQRIDVWREAKLAKDELSGCDKEVVRHGIVRSALGLGCFSVWMTVFVDDADMRRRFIDAFPGTRKTCFDADGAVIADLAL